MTLSNVGIRRAFVCAVDDCGRGARETFSFLGISSAMVYFYLHPSFAYTRAVNRDFAMNEWQYQQQLRILSPAMATASMTISNGRKCIYYYYMCWQFFHPRLLPCLQIASSSVRCHSLGSYSRWNISSGYSFVSTHADAIVHRNVIMSIYRASAPLYKLQFGLSKKPSANMPRTEQAQAEQFLYND